MKLQFQLLAFMAALVGLSSAAPLSVTAIEERGGILDKVVGTAGNLGTQVVDAGDTALTDVTNTVYTTVTDGTNTGDYVVTEGANTVYVAVTGVDGVVEDTL